MSIRLWKVMPLLFVCQDALLDMVRRSRIHFVHCILPKADALKALSGSLFKGGECEAQGETGDPGLVQLDVALLRAQLRGSKLLDALRIYRQGEIAALPVYYKDRHRNTDLSYFFHIVCPKMSEQFQNLTLLLLADFLQVTPITWCSPSFDGALTCWHRTSPRSTGGITS